MTKYMQSKKTMYRNSSIELLRIISMVMIMFIMEILNGIIMKSRFHIFGIILFLWEEKLVSIFLC